MRTIRTYAHAGEEWWSVHDTREGLKQNTVGFGVLVRGEMTLSINHIHIKKIYRGFGHGARLINGLKKLATRENIGLATVADDELALFYKKHGFTAIDVRNGAIHMLWEPDAAVEKMKSLLSNKSIQQHLKSLDLRTLGPRKTTPTLSKPAQQHMMRSLLALNSLKQEKYEARTSKPDTERT
jgi:GNAT superfamily N-acetyltransferase